MAEIATIARPYAEALFKAVVGQSADAAANLGTAAAWLDGIAAVSANAQFQQFAADPGATGAQVLELLTSVAKVHLPDLGKNFVNTLLENNRISALPEIAGQFAVLKNAHGGVADAVVESAFPIAGAALADLVATLEKRFARKLRVSVKLVPELIGGVRVLVGDEVLDTSVRARLDQMKTALAA